MPRPVNVKDINNIVSFRKQSLAVFGKNDSDVFVVSGTDDKEVAKEYTKLVNGEIKSLIVNNVLVRRVVINGDIENINVNLESKINTAHNRIGSEAWMPSTFDFDNRCAYKMNNEDHLKYTNAYGFKYLKYCLSIIGNPRYFLIWTIDKYSWKEVVKRKYNN